MSAVTLANGKTVDTGLLDDKTYLRVLKAGLLGLSRSGDPEIVAAIEAATLRKPKKRRTIRDRP